MVRYKPTTGQAHIITEYDPEENVAITACGLELTAFGVHEYKYVAISGPDTADQCQNCERAHGWRGHHGDGDG